MMNVYEVAGIKFTVHFSAEFENSTSLLLENYAPFALNGSLDSSNATFEVNVERQSERAEFVEETRQVEEGQSILCGRNSVGENVFEFLLADRYTGTLICSDNFLILSFSLNHYPLKYFLPNVLTIF